MYKVNRKDENHYIQYIGVRGRSGLIAFTFVILKYD